MNKVKDRLYYALGYEHAKGLAEFAPTALVRTALDGTILFANEKCSEVFGYTDTGDLCDARAHNFYVDPSDRDEMIFILSENGEARNREVLFKRFDGTLFWGLVSSRIALDTDGQTVIDTVISDISELRERYRGMADSSSQAEAATVAQQQFLNLISHELRTPLNAIDGIARMLRQELLNQENEEHLNELVKNSELLGSMISDILELSDPSSDQMEIRSESFRFVDLVNALKEQFEGIAIEKGLLFVVEVDESVPEHLVSDRLRLKQMLVNLLSNAFRFTQAGQVRLGFSIRMQKEKQYLKAVVADTGIGIEEQNISALFEPFLLRQRAKPGAEGGMGVGLAVVKRISEAFGGSVIVQSSEDSGTTMTLSIPVEFAEVVTDEVETIPVDEVIRIDGMRILVAEDNEVNALIIQRLISFWGGQATVLNDGSAVVDAAATEKFDAILMDIQMPRLDGYAATRLIRTSEGPNVNTPIIAVSASLASEIEEKSKEFGIDEVVLKPFTPERLLKVLKRRYSSD